MPAAAPTAVDQQDGDEQHDYEKYDVGQIEFHSRLKSQITTLARWFSPY